MNNSTIILGAGITGLSAGYQKSAPIFEALNVPGGICASYYLGTKEGKSNSRISEETFRFEAGGGHWIFDTAEGIGDFIQSICAIRWHDRKAAVYLPQIKGLVPYPIQNHLSYLPDSMRQDILREILRDAPPARDVTMADWLESNFGRTLCELFFFPFHNLYTAGLYTQIAPQDPYKSPIDKHLIRQGATEKTPAVGYNTKFLYPVDGLDGLVNGLAKDCNIKFNHQVIKIDVASNTLLLADGKTLPYKHLISTFPLNLTLELAGLANERPAPYTSVLVINIGAQKGPQCPTEHWIYTPHSKTGFHRIGFYSNVDASFLPKSSREKDTHVSIYAEKAYPAGTKPSPAAMDQIGLEIIRELQDWGMITAVEVMSPTWVEVAYTWQYPDSEWVNNSTKLLKSHHIIPTGRYGKWKFQGIAESIQDGRTAL